MDSTIGLSFTFVAIGDSIISPDSPFNNGIDPINELIIKRRNSKINWINDSWPGRTTDNLAQYVKTLRTESDRAPYLFLFQLGTNNFNHPTPNASRIYEDIVEAALVLKNAESWIAACTILPRDDHYADGGWTLKRQQQLNCFNHMMVENSAGLDYVVDFYIDNKILNKAILNDQSLFSDGLHPSFPQGWTVLAPHYLALLDRFESDRLGD